MGRLSNAPLGTLAPAIMGGAWCRVPNGWQWNGHLEPGMRGSTFPGVGGDWDGRLIYPNEQRQETAVLSRPSEPPQMPLSKTDFERAFHVALKSEWPDTTQEASCRHLIEYLQTSGIQFGQDGYAWTEGGARTLALLLAQEVG